jgi:uncharacterized iron-regulated protein
MHPFRCLPLTLFFAALLSMPAYGTSFVRLADKTPILFEGVATDVAAADVVFIGEIHDNAAHHKVQLDLIRSLHAGKPPIAVGLEMFTRDDQQALDDWVTGKLDEEAFRAVCARSWSYGWPLYRDILMFARENRIPLIALNIPKQTMSAFMAQGRAALPASETPPHVSFVLNDSQTAYLRATARQAFGSTPPEKLLARLCEAQALRNHGMAWHIAEYRKRRPGDTVVVLAGMWHAVKNGVPELLAEYGNLTYRVLVPELPEFKLERATDREADYMLLDE